MEDIGRRLRNWMMDDGGVSVSGKRAKERNERLGNGWIGKVGGKRKKNKDEKKVE